MAADPFMPDSLRTLSRELAGELRGESRGIEGAKVFVSPYEGEPRVGVGEGRNCPWIGSSPIVPTRFFW